MKEVRIRGLDNSVVEKLREISSRSYYKSLNQYLVAVLTEVANSDGLLPLEKEVRRRHLEVARQIERNTEVMLKVVNSFDRRRDQ